MPTTVHHCNVCLSLSKSEICIMISTVFSIVLSFSVFLSQAIGSFAWDEIFLGFS